MQFLSAGGLADIGRAQIEGLAIEVDFDAVEKFGPHHFHAHDVAAAGGNKFLHQRRVVEAQIEGPGPARPDQSSLMEFEAGDARAAAADVGLYHDGEAKPGGRLHRVGVAVDDPRPGIGKPQRFQQ